MNVEGPARHRSLRGVVSNECVGGQPNSFQSVCYVYSQTASKTRIFPFSRLRVLHKSIEGGNSYYSILEVQSLRLEKGGEGGVFVSSNKYDILSLGGKELATLVQGLLDSIR